MLGKIESFAPLIGWEEIRKARKEIKINPKPSTPQRVLDEQVQKTSGTYDSTGERSQRPGSYFDVKA